MNYLDLGYDGLGIKTLTTSQRKSAQQIRNELQYGDFAATSIFKATTIGAPEYKEGGVYYDETLHKFRVGGATAWETITSSV